ncbi:hypothetical protein ACH5RR_015854 [Cinchona calisaya]|uniref:Retrovirus-related Pol polyprotein from transposon TNT 1-94-like beta-barrel domain-containing protein n=1 Tax=Cinchona calisaya TaxID=153742 RepID=A0ABD2ZXR0_9GENT
MTSSSKSFLTYSPCLNKDNIRIADGCFTSISGTGSIDCTPNIKVSFVLHVPSFPINLLSVNSITKALNCKAEFFPLGIPIIMSSRTFKQGRRLALVDCKMAYTFWKEATT